jgi:Zn-dependent peptidase ImmA (M78 family)
MSEVNRVMKYPRRFVEAQAESLARSEWEAEGLPIDPVAVAKRAYNAQVVIVSLPDEVSAMLLGTSSAPIIAVSDIDPVNRQRFSIAHEIGHIVHQALQHQGDGGDISYELVEFRNPKSSEGEDPAEIFANQFAAALLMPSELVRAFAASDALEALAVRFGVSTLAMQNRLLNLHIQLPEETAESAAEAF